MTFVNEDEQKVEDGITDRALVISRMHTPYVETTYHRFMGVAHRMALAAYPGILPTHERVKTLARFIARQEQMLRDNLVVDYDSMVGNGNLTSLDGIRGVDVLMRDVALTFSQNEVDVSQSLSSLINHPRSFLTGQIGGQLIANEPLFKRAAAILTLLRFPTMDGRDVSGNWAIRNSTFQSGGNPVQLNTRAMGLNESIFHYVPRIRRIFGFFRHHNYLIMNWIFELFIL